MGLYFEEQQHKKISVHQLKELNFILGSMYEKGLFVSKNFKHAFKYFEKAGNQEHVDALNKLGDFYYSGMQSDSFFLEKNQFKALEFYEYSH